MSREMTDRKISHYRIQKKLGEGGMGVVYQAEDTRLERAVALKFLAPRLLSDDETRRRFEREAKAVAALDHPNICTVFEIDEANGTIFLAMAFVEGPTVKEKIAERPLPLGEALEIALQTAEGLRAAHDKGIVHRDIKPANVMINPQRQVKIMDFGLARLTDATVTQGSAISGTPAYMSPEQSRGEVTDHRTDIWSLGVMLYEMVTGRLPFPGQRADAVFHAIQSAEPEPVTALRAGVPMELELVIRKCLAKNPGRRYQHMDDLIVDLAALRKNMESGAPGGARSSGRAAIQRAVPLAVVAVVAAASAFIGLRVFRHSPETVVARTIKFTITPSQLSKGSYRDIDAAVFISGDGKHIAYVESSNRQLWIRDLDQEQARPVTGATSVYEAFWSPDNQFIGYATGPRCSFIGPCDLVRIPVQGGTPVVITKLLGFRRAFWSSDGETIVYADTTGLYTVPARGGSAVRVTQNPPVIDPGGNPHTEHPSFIDLPGGRRAFLYQGMVAPQTTHGIYLQVMGEDRVRLLTMTSSTNPYPAYSPTGHIVYTDGNYETAAILALPFSIATLQPAGKPFPIAQHGSSPRVSRTGTLVYSDVPSNHLQLLWCDRSGKTISTIGEPMRQGSLALSPDGRKLAIQGNENEIDIWIYDLERGIKTRFTFDSAMHSLGAWTPSGEEVTYTAPRGGNVDIFSKPSSGNGDAKLLAGTPLNEDAPDWSPDQSTLIYAAGSRQTNSQLVYRKRRQDGSLGDPIPLRKTRFNERAPRFSPDGRLVAYVSDESGRNEVYICDFPDAANRWQISANGGTAPRWKRDGREMFYVGQGKLMAVSIAARPTFSPGAPETLFENEFLQIGYDVAADGKRFVILEKPSGEPPLSIHVVHNWFEEFRGRQRDQSR